MTHIITAVNLAAIDLNLLLVLHTVLEERSATRAAKRLHVTQSAVSNALRRLRELFGDPLVTRTPGGLVPTPRALQLAPSLSAALVQLEEVVAPTAEVRPEEVSRTFALAAADGQQLHDVPRVVEALGRRMPRAILRVVSIDYLMAHGGLLTSDVDVTFTPQLGGSAGICTQALYGERGVLAVRQGHPTLRKRVTPARFNACGHVMVHVAFGGRGQGQDATEKYLRQHGFHRRTAAIVPSFAAAAMIAAQTELVAAIPHRVGDALARYLPLRLLEIPIPAFRLQVALAWHRKNDADPVARHFRQVIIDALEESPRSPRPR